MFAAGLSYLFFGERINLVQLLGIFVLIASCAIISITGEEVHKTEYIPSSTKDSDSNSSMVIVVLYGILIAVTVACESTIT